tara:strand:- start:1157 stop:1483 length:327 start_codon:yes stop_codon:yes gene_type:complete
LSKRKEGLVDKGAAEVDSEGFCEKSESEASESQDPMSDDGFSIDGSGAGGEVSSQSNPFLSPGEDIDVDEYFGDAEEEYHEDHGALNSYKLALDTAIFLSLLSTKPGQ